MVTLSLHHVPFLLPNARRSTTLLPNELEAFSAALKQQQKCIMLNLLSVNELFIGNGDQTLAAAISGNPLGRRADQSDLLHDLPPSGGGFFFPLVFLSPDS